MEKGRRQKTGDRRQRPEVRGQIEGWKVGGLAKNKKRRVQGVKESEKQRVQGVEDSRIQVVLLESFYKTKRGKESEKTGFATHLCIQTSKLLKIHI